MATLKAKFVGNHAQVVTTVSRRLKQDASSGIKVLNNPGEFRWINIDDITIPEYQRETLATWCASVLTKRTGFDWNAYGVVYIADTPKGLIITDGLGRYNLAISAGVKEIPAYVTKMSYEDSAYYFSYSQKEGKRGLTPEHLFVAEHEGGNPEALELEQLMLDIGVCVRKDQNSTIPTNSNNPVIRIAALKRSLQFSTNREVLCHAVESILDMYPDSTEIQQDLFVGLVIFYETYPSARRPGKTHSAFNKFLRAVALLAEPKKLPFKREGGNQHNKEYASVAYGMLKLFRQSSMATRYLKENLQLSVIEEAFDLD